MAADERAYEELRCYTLAHRDPSFIHEHVVNAFTAQRADAEPQSIALTFALVGLYLLVEKQFSGKQICRVKAHLARKKRAWAGFALPADRGLMSAIDVMTAPAGLEREEAIHAWCVFVRGALRHLDRSVTDLLPQHGVLDRPAAASAAPAPR